MSPVPPGLQVNSLPTELPGKLLPFLNMSGNFDTGQQESFWILGSRLYLFKLRLTLFCNIVKLLAGEGNGTPLQYSCLENPMDGGAWKAAVHGVAKSWI